MKILVVEDDKTLNMSISKMLDKIADIDSVYDGEDALFQCEQDIYDLIILDVMLPHIDGFTILEKLRKFSNCPVLMLTAKTSVNDRVKGLNLGADDYLTKPFFRDELIARVEDAFQQEGKELKVDIIIQNHIEKDHSGKIVRINGNSLDLVGKTYDILEYLVRNKEIIIPKEQLFNRIWGFDSDTVWSVVEVYVSNLRKTLKDFGYNNYLKTIRNVGYMWSEKI